MNTKIRYIIKQRFIKSYGRGIAKSMDANNEIRIFQERQPATVLSSWQDVGKDLTYAMTKYDGKESSTTHA